MQLFVLKISKFKKSKILFENLEVNHILLTKSVVIYPVIKEKKPYFFL